MKSYIDWKRKNKDCYSLDITITPNNKNTIALLLTVDTYTRQIQSIKYNVCRIAFDGKK